MASLMAVNERTIRRDLHLLLEAGVGMRQFVGHRGKKAWCVDDRAPWMICDFSVDEALILIVAEKIIPAHDGSRLYSAVKRCRDKILASLNQQQRAQLENYASQLATQLDNDRAVSALLAELEPVWQSFEPAS